jgi:hypothetical protein
MKHIDGRQVALDEISNDMMRWNLTEEPIDDVLRALYIRDLGLAAVRLEDLIDDIKGKSYVRIVTGDIETIGTRIVSGPMRSLDAIKATVAPQSSIALNHVWTIDADATGRYQKHFGNRAIYFSTTQLATVLDKGARMAID